MNKLLYFTLIFALILSIGTVTAEDNITFEKSNISEYSIEKDNQNDKLSVGRDNEISTDSNDESVAHRVSGNNFTDIQNAIDAASDGDTIFLDGKTYSGVVQINITKKLNIIGGSSLDDDSYSTLDGGGITRIMQINASDVVIKGIKFTNGYAPIIKQYDSYFDRWDDIETNGGAIDMSDCSNIKILNCGFTNNRASLNGGAICAHLFVSNVEINGCIFENNQASNGAILTLADNVSIFNSNFSNNSGGAIVSSGGNFILDYCKFENHQVYHDGASLTVSGFNSTITNCLFKNSSTTNRDGGTLVLNGAHNSTVKGNSFIDSHSARHGGAIFLPSNNVVIENNKFYLCSAGGNGDTIWIGGVCNRILNNTFYNSSMGIYEVNPGGTVIENNTYGVFQNFLEVNDSFEGFAGSSIQVPVYVHVALDWPLDGVVSLYGWGDQTLVDGRAMFVINLPVVPTVFNSYVKYGDMVKNIVIKSVSRNSIVSITQNDDDAVIVELASGATGVVVVNIDGVNYFADVINSTASVKPLGLVNGRYVAFVQYLGDENYSNELTVATINITKAPICKIEVNDSIEGFSGTSIQVPVHVHDESDNPLGGVVSLYGWGDQTLVDGRAMFVINLPVVPTVFNSYVKYGDMVKNIVIKSVSRNSILGIAQNEDDAVIVELASGATGVVVVNVDGVNYFADVINSTASVKPLGLVNGQYVAFVQYLGDKQYSAQSTVASINITQSPVYKITQNRDINAVYSGSAIYKVQATSDGKIAAGENVLITFNGKNINVKTDANGYATLNINTNLKLGTYTVKANYNGVVVTNKVKINQVIKASDKKVKKSSKQTKVKISLIKVDGKYLKSKTLNVKFNGKTYKVKTNSKGVGIWKVKKSMLKKLKVGKKVKYTVTYGKATLTKKLTIKK